MLTLLLQIVLVLSSDTNVQSLAVDGEIDRIRTRFIPPAGFQRTETSWGTFGAWLAASPLLPQGSPVLQYDGKPKGRQDVHAAVLDLSVGNKDLQQCADAVMRLRAEFLFSQKRYTDIHFNFTNGFTAEFSRWAGGERIAVQGNKCQWKPGGSTGCTHANLMTFLDMVYTYAGTLSLNKELIDASTTPLRPGDVFIHGGSPGHAMIVMDLAVNAQGEQTFLLAQSYMPAQQVHVVRNLRHGERGAWFTLNEDDRVYTPEWTFDRNERKRWP